MKNLFSITALLVVLGAVATYMTTESLQARAVNAECQYGSRNDILPLEKREHLAENGRYQWERRQRDWYARYLCDLWKAPMKIRHAEGLESTAVKVTEHSDRDCNRDIDQDHPPLRVEGGRCSKAHWLEIMDVGTNYTIRTFEDLKIHFPVVRTPAMALSFVAVTQADLVTDDKGRIFGHVIAVRQGYLVHVTRKNTFGCGWHVPVGMLFYVSRSGRITTVAVQYEEEGGKLCVD